MMPTRSAVSLRRAAAVALVTLGLSAAGCGIPLDDAPRAIEVPTTEVNTDADQPDQSGQTTVYLYYLNGDRLSAVSTDGAAMTAGDVLSALFAGVPSAAPSDVLTQIPSGTRLLNATSSDGLLTIDVSDEFGNLVGSGRTMALAQIVVSATELASVDRVTMTIEGAPVAMYSPEAGDVSVVSACDYLPLMPDTVDSLEIGTADAESVDALSGDDRHLYDRVDTLRSICE